MKKSRRVNVVRQPGDITLLLSEMQNGKLETAGKLLPLVYGELRQMAGRKVSPREA